MTTTTPSRRERLRTATVNEIKTAARRLLVDGGPPAISLRAIARDMGMTAPAIYRYFDSLDALVIAMVSDFFDELRDDIETLAVAHADADAATRLSMMVRGFRRWAVQHPAEFALMFGSPVPGITQFAATCDPVDDAGARLGAMFLNVLGELYEDKPFPEQSDADLDEVMRTAVAPYFSTFGDRFALPVVYAFLACWTSLYGLVAMEVFGHLQWAMTDVEPLFELQLHRVISQLADGT